jgi:SOS-response transcriptional repressor LexA
MKNQGLPPQQRAVCDFIVNYRQKNDFSPSYGEIAAALDLSHSTVVTYVDILRRKGVVHSLPGIPRTLTVNLPETIEAETSGMAEVVPD